MKSPISIKAIEFKLQTFSRRKHQAQVASLVKNGQSNSEKEHHWRARTTDFRATGIQTMRYQSQNR